MEDDGNEDEEEKQKLEQEHLDDFDRCYEEVIIFILNF